MTAPESAPKSAPKSALGPPIGLLAELTHRCPLQCPYCSNPQELVRRGEELDTAAWIEVFRQARALGVLQLHLSGGEPGARSDLPALVGAARQLGLYSNLITAGVLLDEAALAALAARGLDHVQLSLQAAGAQTADSIGGFREGHARKLAFAAWVRAQGLPLTINVVLHRRNLDDLPALIDLALRLDAHRLELAHSQYYGWALRNRAALLPSRAQVERATALVERARRDLKDRLPIDYVTPDYYARRPKRCMDGWARRVIVVTPRGRALPCHAAETIPDLDFPNVRDSSLESIWRESEAFNRYRGTDWMREPCRSCEFRERDLGGCRCQAFALTGEAARADPVCDLSPDHAALQALAAEAAAADGPPYRYRRFA